MKTYTELSTGVYGGETSSWSSAKWNSFRPTGGTGTTNRWQGRQSVAPDVYYYCTNILFDATKLATLRTKNVQSVTLRITVTSGTIPPSGTQRYPIGYKYNSDTGISSNVSSNAWARSNYNCTEMTTDTIGYVCSAGGSVEASNTVLDISLGKNVPKYGYVLGPEYTASNGLLRIASSATLIVVTDENDYSYTLAYNANNGSGAPNSQTGTSVGTSPSFTFTVSSTVPSRTGYTFLGWSTSNSATTASYVGGNTITVTSAGTTTLYAVWKVITYTVSYNANGGTGAPAAQTKTYGVNLTLSSTAPTRTNYIFQGWATSSTGAVAYQPSGTYSTNASVTLYAIWKQAAATLNTVTATDIGSNGTASWTKINSTDTYKLVLSMSGASSVTVNVAANSASTTFTIPTTWYSALPNGTSATATAVLYTYNGSTLVGSTQKTFTVSVASTVKPTISSVTATPHSDNATIDGWALAVQGYSYLTIAVSATAGSGASISSISISGHGINQSSTSTSGNTAILTSTGSQTYTITVRDSRGRVASTTKAVTIYAYSNPEITGLSAIRCLSDGTASDIEGNYIKAMPVFVFSSVNSKNSLTVKKIEYKMHSAYSWTTVTTAAVSGSYTSPFGVADITKTYDVRCTITDAVGNTYTLVVSVPPVVGFAIGLKNDRARFGGPVEKAGLQIDWNTEINGVLDVTPRRTSAYLSTTGWYRVLTYVSINAADIAGAIGLQIDFVVNRGYSYVNNETHRVTLSMTYNGAKFVDESSRSNYLGITKIRYTTNTTGTYKFGYVDIYYGLSNSNAVYVDFTVHQAAASIQAAITASDLTGVADSPSGETVLTEYTFSENVSSQPTATRQHSATASAISGGAQGSCDIPIGIGSGWTAIGIMEVFGSGNSGLALIQYALSDQTKARIVYQNVGSVSRTPTWYVTILYQKD